MPSQKQIIRNARILKLV